MRLFVFVLLALASVSARFVKVPRNHYAEDGIELARRIKEYADSVVKESEDAVAPARIVGGVTAPINAHPYLAGLVVIFPFPPQRACGASLVSNTKLVTAAHCWFTNGIQATQFEVVLGSQFLFTGGTRIVTNNVVVNPLWSPLNWIRNDIAIITLPTPVTFTSAIQPIALPLPSDLSQTFDFQQVVAAGYGITNDMQQGVPFNTVVSHVNLVVMPLAQCRFTYDVVENTHLCTSGAGGVGVCGGDSGGPLVLNRNGVPTLIGVSSFAADVGCQLGHPSGYTRVTSFYNFIMQNL